MTAKIKQLSNGNITLGKADFQGLGDEQLVEDEATIQKCRDFKFRLANGTMINRFQVDVLQEATGNESDNQPTDSQTETDKVSDKKTETKIAVTKSAPNKNLKGTNK